MVTERKQIFSQIEDGTRKKPSQRNKQILLVIMLLILAVLCRFLGNLGFLPYYLGLLRSAIYISLFLAWSYSLYIRILQTQVCRYLMAISILMVFWFVVRTLKFHFVIDVNLARHLWYLYYLPMLFIPLLAVFVALSLGMEEDKELPKWTRLLYI